ncbi:MAG: DNA polymerase III subunit beta, partial [Chloroflexi bacterium]|nr:DNA polymerase III subunit beta [Chloroflexota bacterium]
MRLSCLQENLARGLSTVQRAVNTRTTLPITQNVLISTDQSQLKLSATNLEIAITTWLGAQVEEEGSITIPARLLTEFVASLPSERIDIESTAQPKGLALHCASFEAHINGTDAEDFPPIPNVDSGVVGKIDPKVLRDAITHVAFAAATEDSRPVLTGVKVEITGDDFTFAAADGFRLAVYKGKLAEAMPEEINFIIPSKAMQEVSRAIASQEELVEFTVTPNKSQALFKLNNVEIVSQLIQGTFPNYSQLIPQSYGTRAVVGLDDFLRATRTASIFAKDGSGIVRLQMSGGDNGSTGRLRISSRAEELGDNQGEISAQVEGDDSKIAFNAKYLSEVLDVLGSGEVALETTSPSSPGVLKL